MAYDHMREVESVLDRICTCSLCISLSQTEFDELRQSTVPSYQSETIVLSSCRTLTCENEILLHHRIFTVKAVHRAFTFHACCNKTKLSHSHHALKHHRLPRCIAARSYPCKRVLQVKLQDGRAILALPFFVSDAVRCAVDNRV